MNTKNSALVDVSPFLLFEASADSETHEDQGGHEGDDDDNDYGNDAESTSQVTSGSAGFNSVEMDEEDGEGEEELVTGEKEEHDEEEVNSHGRWPERRGDESRSVDSSFTGNDERLMRRKKIENDRMFWEACLAS